MAIVLSLPILLAAFFMNKWRGAGYALLTLVIVVIVAFKIIEFKLKSKYSKSGFAEKDEALEKQRPPAAGPLDGALRKQQVDVMLNACGLPTIAHIEPHFNELGEL